MRIKLNENENSGMLYAIAYCEDPDIYSEEFWGWDTESDVGYELMEFGSLIQDADVFDSLEAAEDRADDVLSSIFEDEVFIVGLDPYTPHNLTGFVKKVTRDSINESKSINEDVYDDIRDMTERVKRYTPKVIELANIYRETNQEHSIGGSWYDRFKLSVDCNYVPKKEPNTYGSISSDTYLYIEDVSRAEEYEKCALYLSDKGEVFIEWDPSYTRKNGYSNYYIKCALNHFLSRADEAIEKILRIMTSESKSIKENADSYDTTTFDWSPNWIGGSLYQAAFITCHPNIDDDTYPYYWGKVYHKGPSFYVPFVITEDSEEADAVEETLGRRYYDVYSAKSAIEDWIKAKLNGTEIEEDDVEEDDVEEDNSEEINIKEIEDELLWRGMRGEYSHYEDTVAFKMADKAESMGMDHNDAYKLACDVVAQMHDKRFEFEDGEANESLNKSKSIKESTAGDYVEVAYICDGFTNFRVFGGGFKTSDALVSVEDEKGKRLRLTMGDVCEFYTWHNAKGNVIHEPGYIDDANLNENYVPEYGDEFPNMNAAMYVARSLVYHFVSNPDDAEKLYAKAESDCWESSELVALCDLIGDALEASNYHSEAKDYFYDKFPYWWAFDVSAEDEAKMDELIESCDDDNQRMQLLIIAVNSLVLELD